MIGNTHGNALKSQQMIQSWPLGWTSLASSRATSDPSLSMYGQPLQMKSATHRRHNEKMNALELQTMRERILLERHRDN